MIQGPMLRDAMISAANALSNQKEQVDALNVFPVPDGDTGTNMSMTIGNAARELARLEDPNAHEVAKVASAGMLRGARGNSGVILSLLFRGFSKGLKGKEEAGGADLAQALTLGTEGAYKAVMKPTEGTILTVARESAAAGKAVAETNDDPIAVWEAICDEAEASLTRTPDLLPQLKKAGVVDAGGQGLCIVMRAMLDVFKGGEIVAGRDAAPAVKPAAAQADMKYGYTVAFALRRDPKSDRAPAGLRAYLESIGDEVAMEDTREVIKAKANTDHPGKAIEEALKFGCLETVTVENRRLQAGEAAKTVEIAQPAEEKAALQRVEPENDFGFVAVAAGAGLENLFREDLACDNVVSGGQTMNPSTDDILQAIEATPAKTVFVLPNNKNIILAAEQAAPLADRKVCVLPTRTIPQGISAVLAYNPDADEETNVIEMQRAADNVSTGSVTFAARDSDFDGHKIHEGQILALDNGKLSFVDSEVSHAVAKLSKNLANGRRAAGKEVNFVTVIYGQDVGAEEAEQVCDAIRTKLGDGVDVSAISGGQPVYYYYLSIE